MTLTTELPDVGESTDRSRPHDAAGGFDLLQMQTTGFCVIDDVIPAEEVAAVRDGVLTAMHDTQVGATADGIWFLPSLTNHDQSVVPYLRHTRLTALADRLVGPFWHVSFVSSIINMPGNPRGGWHADWPYNQKNAGHIPAPYPDVTTHLTTLWMLSPFSAATGGTLVVPGSHRLADNPTSVGHPVGEDDVLPHEAHATGAAGSVLVMDSRCWHASAPNHTNEPRVALAIRFAPWWLNLDVVRPGTWDRHFLAEGRAIRENETPWMSLETFRNLPDDLQLRFRSMIDR